MVRPKKSTDHRIALHSATGFHKMAQTFFEKLKGKDVHEGVKILADSPGDFICASTNLCLAIELYLKSIKIGLGEDITQTHNLLTLFNDLSPDVRAQLEQIYESHISKFGEKDLKQLALIINSAYDSVKKAPDFDTDDKSLAAVLNRSSNGFTAWRYFFETMEVDETQSKLEVEYDHLHQIGNILSYYILQNDAEFEKNSVAKLFASRKKPIAKDSPIFLAK